MRPDNDRITVIKELAIPNNKKELQSILGIINYVRKIVLELLHETHLSPDKQKCMTKNTFYWPGINSDIINLTEDCMICHKKN